MSDGDSEAQKAAMPAEPQYLTTPAREIAPDSLVKGSRVRSRKNMGACRMAADGTERCVNSKCAEEPCACPLASVICARQSKIRDSFFAAVQQNRADVVEFLLSAQHCERERIDVREWMTVRDTHGRCGVHRAVLHKRERILAVLLEHCCKEVDAVRLVDQQDNEGFSAMLEAVRTHGSLRMVQTLSSAGAAWTTVNNESRNARDIGLALGHENIVAHFDQKGDTHDQAQAEKASKDSESEGEESDHVSQNEECCEEGKREVVDDKREEQGTEAEIEIGDQDLQDRCEVLRINPVFEKFEVRHVEMIARYCELRKFRRNDVIWGTEVTAEARQCMIFVFSGEVRVEKVTNKRHDEVLDEGDIYGEMELLLGQESTDVLSAKKDCYLMFVRKAVLVPIMRENHLYAQYVAFALAAKFEQDSKKDKSEFVLETDHGTHILGQELQERIIEFYGIELPLEAVELETETGARARKIVDQPLLVDENDVLPIKMMHANDFGVDLGVNSRLLRSAASIEEEYIYQYVQGCREMGTQPLYAAIFQMRRKETVLDLRALGIISKDALALSAALSYMMHCQGIDLSSNPIFDAGCVNSDSLNCCGIVNSLNLNSSVQTVILHATSISHVTAIQLGRVLSFHGAITKLDLSSNNIRDAGIEALAEGLAASHSVRDLNLSNTKCTFQGATCLAKMLHANQTLEVVNLSWNNFLSKGSRVLLQSMAAHPKLTEVHLEWNLLGHMGGIELGKLLHSTHTIRRIDASHCQIPSTAADAIRDGLINNCTIENLRLHFNPLKDGVPRVKAAIFSNAHWQEDAPTVRLDHCDFDAVDYHASKVNLNIPTGHYRFDCSLPGHRKELEKLVNLATRENGENWRNETMDGVRFHFPRSSSWKVPANGVLELDFVHMARSKSPIMTEDLLQQFMRTLNQAVSPEARIDVIKQACSGFRFLGDDAMAVMYCLNRTAEREEALVTLFSQICGREAIIPKMLLSCFDRREVEHIQFRLGTYYAFDSQRPEGKYRFDLGKRLDIDALCHLIDVKQKITGSHFMFAKLYDLRSRANPRPVEKVEDLLTGDNLAELGILELMFSVPRTQEAHTSKKMFVDAELAQLERSRSVSKDMSAVVSLVSLGFDIDAMRDGQSSSDSGEEEIDKSFDFDAMMNRTRAEYKLVTVLHPDLSGIVKCSDMNDKPFNSQWDGGKTSIVVMLEEKEHKRLVNVMTPRGEHVIMSKMIEWNTPFRTTLDIAKTEDVAQEVFQRAGSEMHQALLQKFVNKRHSAIKHTVPKKDGKGLRPMTPDTFCNVKSLNFDLALRRSNGVRMYKPWTGFVRSDPADFRIQHVHMHTTGHKGATGISKRLTGSLLTSSCVNYEMDLSFLVNMHTVPRFFCFTIKEGRDLDLYVSTKSLPWERDHMWKGELTEAGERVVTIRPTDRNYAATRYYISIMSNRNASDYELLAEISPYQSSLKTVEELKLPRFSNIKVKSARSGLLIPKKVGDMTAQNSKTGKMLSSLMMFTEERRSKSCFGAAVPEKAVMLIKGQASHEPGNLRRGQSSISEQEGIGRLQSAKSHRSTSSTGAQSSHDSNSKATTPKGQRARTGKEQRPATAMV